MVYFIITLKSKEVSHDFQFVSNCVNKLILHITTYTKVDYKVILARHQKPINFLEHKNLIDIDCSSLKIPLNKSQMMEDKIAKLEVAYNYVYKNGLGPSLQIDYDDSISKFFLESLYNLQMEEGNALYFNRGYIYPEGNNMIYLKDNMHMICGSTWLIFWRKTDFKRDKSGLRNVTRWGHHEFYSNLSELGYNIHAEEKPFCLYRTDNGENHSGIVWRKWQGVKRFIYKLSYGKFFWKSKRQEFGII